MMSQLVRYWFDVDAAPFAIKEHRTIDQCEQCVVIALTDIGTRVETIANLTNDDISCANGFAAVLLHATTLSIRVATITAGALTLLMCHFTKPQSYSTCAGREFLPITDPVAYQGWGR